MCTRHAEMPLPCVARGKTFLPATAVPGVSSPTVGGTRPARCARACSCESGQPLAVLSRGYGAKDCVCTRSRRQLYGRAPAARRRARCRPSSHPAFDRPFEPPRPFSLSCARKCLSPPSSPSANRLASRRATRSCAPTDRLHAAGRWCGRAWRPSSMTAVRPPRTVSVARDRAMLRCFGPPGQACVYRSYGPLRCSTSSAAIDFPRSRPHDPAIPRTRRCRRPRSGRERRECPAP